jgi:ATP-binding cassette subfamily F protein uup
VPPTTSIAQATRKKLSYKDQRELELLPAKIEDLEAQVAAIHAELSDPAFYKQSSAQIAARSATARELDAQLTAAYERWEELEADVS